MAEESVRVLKAVVCSQVGVRMRSGKTRSKPEAVGRENQRGGAIRSSRRAAGRLARERILMMQAEMPAEGPPPDKKRAKLATAKGRPAREEEEEEEGSSSSSEDGDTASDEGDSSEWGSDSDTPPIKTTPTVKQTAKNPPKQSLSEYELKRQRNIEENQRLLSSLGLLRPTKTQSDPSSKAPSKPAAVKKPLKKEGVALEASRCSARLLWRRRKSQTASPASTYQQQQQSETASRGRQQQQGWERKPAGPIAMSCLREPAVSGAEKEEEGEEEEEERFRTSVAGAVSETEPDRPTFSAAARMSVFAGLSVGAVCKVTPARVLSLALLPSPLKTMVAAGDTHGHLGLWDTDSGASYVYEPHSRAVTQLVFSPLPSPRPPLLLSCSYDGTLRAAHFERGVFEEVYSAPEDDNLGFTSCDLSQRSDWLVLGCDNGSLKQLDLRTGSQPVQEWSGHLRAVKCVHLNPTDNHYLATSSTDCTARVWDLRKISSSTTPENCVCRVYAGKSISSAFFSPLTGGKLLLTTLEDSICTYYSVYSEATGFCSSLLPNLRLSHDNHTGRWLTGFRAQWDPRCEECFIVGSMNPTRQVEIYSTSSPSPAVKLRDERLTTVSSLNLIHPTQNLVVGANSSGKAFLWQ